MGRRNIRKIRQTNTPIPQASFASARLANADGESNNNSDSGKDEDKDSGKKTPWWNIADSIADTVVKIYDGVVDPILFGGKGKYTGEVSIRQEKDTTAKYLIIGGVIIVALVLIMKYVKK